MKKLTLALLTTLSTLAMADDELISRPEVQEYIRTTAATHGFSEDLLTYALQNAQTKSNIIAILDRPSTSRPWHEFQANFVKISHLDFDVQATDVAQLLNAGIIEENLQDRVSKSSLKGFKRPQAGSVFGATRKVQTI